MRFSDLKYLFIYFLSWGCQSGELAESVQKIIDSQLVDGIDMSEVQVWYSLLNCNGQCHFFN